MIRPATKPSQWAYIVYVHSKQRMKIRYLIIYLLLTGCLVAFAQPEASADRPPHAVIVIGTYHYNPQTTMPALAKELEKFGFRTTIVQGVGNPELSKLGVDFTEAGARLLTQWHFDEEVTTPIRYQLDPASSTPHETLSYMLYIAKEVGPHINAHPNSLKELINPQEDMLEYIGLSKDELADCLVDSQATIRDSKNLLTTA